MKVQYENKVMSSLLLFIDHEVTQKGDAYTDHQSNFFKIMLTIFIILINFFKWVYF